MRQIQPKVPLRKQRPGRLFLLSDVKFPPQGERRIGRAKREAVLLSKVKHLEIWNFSALPQTFQSLRTADAAQPLRKPRRRYWDTEHQRHLLNLVPDNATLFPILNLLEFLCILGSCF